MANLITAFRIICSIFLLFAPTFSTVFYVLYAVTGVSDMLDGFVARKTRTVSAFGAKFDSIADFIFIAVCLIKIFPILSLPLFLWIWIAAIVMIKSVNAVTGIVLYQKMVMPHTAANKLTGLLLFVSVFFLQSVSVVSVAAFLCATAIFAAIREGCFVVKYYRNAKIKARYPDEI